MADTSTQAWSRVADRLGTWSRMLAEQYRRRAQETGAIPAEERRRFEDAVRTATRRVDRALSSIGDTLRDPEARRTLRDAIRSLGEAVSLTVAEVGGRVRAHLGSSEPSGPSSS
jgi:hypothetical protein